ALDDRLESGKTYFWRVDALSSVGKVIMSGPSQSFVAEPRSKAALRDLRGQFVQLASLGMPAGLLPYHAEIARAGDAGLIISAPDLPAQIAKRAPEPDSNVTESQPQISIELKVKFNPIDVNLMLDDLDVTSMARVS